MNVIGTASYASPLGEILVAFSEDALTGLWFTGQKHFPTDLPAPSSPEDLPAVACCVLSWLDRYFAGEAPDVTFPVRPEGSPFQTLVWTELSGIPYGETVTYGDIASRLAAAGRKTSPRAVGGAVARNPVSIVIPCHRVLGSGGTLHGYAGGPERKKALLRLEQQ